MTHSVIVKPAEVPERAAALRMAFRHLDADFRAARVALAMEMIDRGDLDPDGILTAWLNEEKVGAMVAAPVPGAAAAVWPPQVTSSATNDDDVADALVRYAVNWLRRRGAKLAQGLITPEDSALAGPLLRNGFRLATTLWYLRHDLSVQDPTLFGLERLRYTTFSAEQFDRFAAIMARTYEGTQDCPEIGGARTPADAIAGHQAGGFEPDRWWLAEFEGEPVGLLLVNDSPEGEGWEIAYVGVVPEYRRRGFGRELVLKAIIEAKVAGMPLLMLAVDARNHPARELYRRLGFTPHESRDVLLAVWGDGDLSADPAISEAG